jgi:fructose-specific PTS system IIA-like component
MLPMISRVEELIWCREVLESVKQEMRHEGLAFDEQTALGIMLEVPSVLFLWRRWQNMRISSAWAVMT